MVHKKFTYKEGRKYGPYLYKTKRIDGKIVTTYLGRENEKRNKSYILPIIFTLILVLLLAFSIFYANLTGKVTLEIKDEFEVGELIGGNLNLNLKEGELLPANTKVILNYNNQSKEFLLRDLISYNSIEGEFFAEGVSLSGTGLGFGKMGKKEIFPAIDFEILITKNNEDGSEIPVETPVENTEEIIENEPTPEVVVEIEEPENSGVEEEGETESSSEEESSGESSITGAVISENEYLVSGTLTKNEEFTYNLGEGEIAKIVSGSVKVNGQSISESELDLEVQGDELTVRTDYFLIEEGFGEDYLGDEVEALEIDLTKFGFVANVDGKLEATVSYEDVKIVSAEAKINLEETEFPGEEENVSEATVGEVIGVPTVEINNSLINETESILNQTLNQTGLNLTSNGTIGSITIETLQERPVIGKPVKWVKKINNDNFTGEVVIELPEEATNYSITNIKLEEIPEERSEDIDGEVEQIFVDKNGSFITGQVTAEIETKSTFTWKKFFSNILKITGFSIDEIQPEVIVELNDSVQSIELEYYTRAPQSFEEESTRGKTIIISAPDELNYTNVLAYTELNNKLQVNSPQKLKIYWVENLSFISPEIIEDVDQDGLYDYLAWNVPHLSNQTFEIILISNALHLDENREFISNIYENVSSLDDIWSETIFNGHYVRVTFEINLTKENDITIYPRFNSSNESLKLEVYEKNKDLAIATFENITQNSYNKVYLTNLNDSQDTFDLKVIGGEIEFDHIIDPNISANGANFDISVVSLDNRTFVIATVNGTNVTFSIFDTNGTSIVSKTSVNTAATASGSRVDVGAINSSTFAITWFNSAGATQDTTYAVYRRTGTIVTGPTDLDAAVGTVGDTARPVIMNNTAMEICFVDQAESDADVNYITINTWGAGTESPGTGADGTITPQATGQNLISCAAVNNTLFAYVFFDDADNDITLVRMTLAAGANTVTSTTDIDNNAGETGQVEVTTLNSSYMAIAWYNSNTTTVNITVRGRQNNVILTPRGIDTNATLTSTDYPRLSMATVRNSSEPFSWFVVAWNDRNDGKINASVYNLSGTLKHNYQLATNQNTSSLLFDIYGRDDLNQSGSCDGTYLFAYQNNTGTTVVRTMNLDGTEWNGVCGTVPDVTSPVVSLLAPTNNSIVYEANNYFAATFNDNVNTTNATLYIYNSTGVLIGSNFTTLANSSILGNISYPLNYSGTFFWNYIARDSSNNIGVNHTNYTLIYYVDTIAPDINFTGPTPNNGTNLAANAIYVNISSNDTNQHIVVTDFNRSLLLWLRMDANSSGSPYDLSTYSRNASLNGDAVLNTTGKFGNASWYDGAGDYISVDDTRAANLTENFTISLWANVRDTEADDAFLGKRGSPQGYVLSWLGSTENNTLRFTFFGIVSQDSTAGLGPVVTTGWQHYAVTYDRVSIKFYKNGSLLSSHSRSNVVNPSSNNLFIGGLNNFGSIADPMNGSLDEVMIFDRPLDDREILSLYNSTQNNYYRNFTSLPVNRSYTFRSYATDLAGNLNSTEQRTVSLVDQLVGPTVTLSLPTNSSNLNYTYVNFSWSATSGVDADFTCNLTVDNIVNASEINSPDSTIVNYSLSTLNQGNHNWSVGCWEAGGPISSSETRLFVYDTIKPVVSFASPTYSNGSTTFLDYIVINASSSDSSDHYTLVDFNRTLGVWYTMDAYNTSGGLADGSLFSRNASPVNGPYTLENGKFGKTFYLDGINDYVDTHYDLDHTVDSNFTFSLWIRDHSVNNANRNIYGKSQFQFSAYMGATNDFNFVYWDSGGTGRIFLNSTPLNKNQWYHTVVTFDGTNDNATLYINGVGITEDMVIDAAFVNRADNLRFSGAHAPGGVSYFNGSLDEFVYFDRTLTPTEVKALYNASANKYFNNFTGLRINNSYSFAAHSVDLAGNLNSTQRFVIFNSTNLGVCGVTLDKGNSVYVVGNNLNSTTDCLTLGSNNATINLNGYNITSDSITQQNIAILINGYNSTSIHNGSIFNYSEAVRSFNNLDNSVYNLTIRANKNVANRGLYGLRLERASRNNITNLQIINLYNIISSGAVAGDYDCGQPYVSFGICLYQSHNATIKDVSITNLTAVITGEGVRIEESNAVYINNITINNPKTNSFAVDVSNYTVSNNLISSSNRSLTTGLTMGGYNNNLTNFTTTYFGASISLVSGSHNLLRNGIVDNSTIFGVSLAADNSTLDNIVLRNTSDSARDLSFSSLLNGTVIIDGYYANYSFSGTGSIVTINKTGTGQIRFLRPINGTGTNFTNDISIKSNNVSVKSTNNIGLNASANITLLNMPANFSAPVIYRDGQLCSDCYNFTSLNVSTVIFNVTSFSDYSVDNENDVVNIAPSNPIVFINSTLGNNRTAENLTCYATIIDPDADLLNVTVRWFNNTIIHLTQDFNNSYSNNSFFSAHLDHRNTTKPENWTCSMRLFDGEAYSSFVNSTNLTIRNTPPPAPSLISPAHSTSTTDRTPTFSWNIISDDDPSDAVSYELNVTCFNELGGSCTNPDHRYITGITGEEVSISYDLVGDLRHLYDNGHIYNWSARAFDGEERGDWATFRTINISALIQISLPNNSINFGLIGIEGYNDTEDNSPRPFLIQNDGNAMTKVSIYGTDLWRTVVNPSNYFSFKISNNTLENGSFNYFTSFLNYTKVPAFASPTLSIYGLNYTDIADSAEIDINITVPIDEGNGLRNSTLTFTASLDEGN